MVMEERQKRKRITSLPFTVPRPGIEPGWIAPLVFETSASTDSAIWASLNDVAKLGIVYDFHNSVGATNRFFIFKKIKYGLCGDF